MQLRRAVNKSNDTNAGVLPLPTNAGLACPGYSTRAFKSSPSGARTNRGWCERLGSMLIFNLTGGYKL